MVDSQLVSDWQEIGRAYWLLWESFDFAECLLRRAYDRRRSEQYRERCKRVILLAKRRLARRQSYHAQLFRECEAGE